MNVCRLCSSNDQLTSIFNPLLSNAEQLRLYFLLATGLEIREDDVVSKLVCHRCCEIAVKLHKYRANAVANDKLLKEQCGQPYTPPATDQEELRRLSAQILTNNNSKGLSATYDATLFDNTKNSFLFSDISIKMEPVDNVPVLELYKHDSVKELYQTYPKIILPEAVYNCDIAPVVTLDENEVEEWAEEEFKRVQQKLSWAKIIIQKVGETTSLENKNENTAISPSSGVNTVPVKRPGPRSRTLHDAYNEKLPVAAQTFKKLRPGPKSKTMGIISENIQPKLVKPDIPQSVLYKPGPMSRKSDLIIHGATTIKPVVQQLSTPPKRQVLKPPEKESTSRKPESAIEVSSSTSRDKIPTSSRRTKASDQLMISDLSDASDDDFDPTSAFMDDVVDESESSSNSETESTRTTSTPVSRMTRNQKNRPNTLDKQQRPKRTITSVQDDKSTKISEASKIIDQTSFPKKVDNKSITSPKSSTNAESEQSTSLAKKPINASHRKNKRTSSNDSHQSDKPVKRGRLTELEKLTLTDDKPKVQKSDSRKISKRRSSKDDLVNKSRNNNDNTSLTDTKEGSRSKVKRKECNKVDNSNSQEKLPKIANTAPVTTKKHSENLPLLVPGKYQKLYMCPTCQEMFNTSRELADHQKTHLICKFCNYRMKNLETLKKHQLENCRMSVVEQSKNAESSKKVVEPLKNVELSKKAVEPSKNVAPSKNIVPSKNIDEPSEKIVTSPQQPVLKLTKVDKNKSILNKYPEAFDSDNKNEGQAIQESPKTESPQPDLLNGLLVNASNIKSEILNVSDDSDDDIQYVDQYTEETVQSTSFLDLPLSGMTEVDMIRSLFVKHLRVGVSKFQRASQTFLPRARDIKYTNSNLIVLENLFGELLTYKIPVQLEIKPRISARFTGPIIPPPKENLENWSHIKPITILRPKPVPKLPSKPIKIAPAKFNTISPAQSPIVSSKSKPVVAESAKFILPKTETPPLTNIKHFNTDIFDLDLLDPEPDSILPSTPAESRPSSVTSPPITTQVAVVSGNIPIQPKGTVPDLVTPVLSPTSSMSNNIVHFNPTTLAKPQTLPSISTQSMIIPVNSIQNQTNVNPGTYSQCLILPTTSAVSTGSSKVSLIKTSVPILPKPPALTLSNRISQSTSSNFLNELLNSSPPVPSLPLLTTNFIDSQNTVDKRNKTPTYVSFLPSSNAPATNLTTTLIQTSNNGTLLLQNDISSNSTTIIQAPSNSTLIQTPGTALIQTGNSTFITPDSTSNGVSLGSNAISEMPQNSIVLMSTTPLATQALVNNQTTISNIPSNNIILQTPAEQIYQISNAGTNVNKVVVLSNTLSNGLQQNMPLYASPYLNNIPTNNSFQQSSVQIEEIEDNPQKEQAGNNALRVKSSWELC